ncbi:conserved Plasmodium protein, unknown function [Plasmodium ovale]|uniref:PH domain-containing protein n=2 Tax=Plasmodium ovale TaxID=36330 RepID=A0A1A8VNZ7_PLAOA|nr:conserved Plasmodium protein, unknown function [Plasmodium ovale curtisi]SCA48554.1 conserved Plasmodium protein, unknown function [Plasmodium ovale]
MKHKIILWNFFLFSLFLLLERKITCQSFLPVSYAAHQLYTFDKLTPHDIKSNLKNIVGNFITTNLKVIKNKFENYKNNFREEEKYDQLIKNDYDTSLEDEVKSLLQQAKNKRNLSKKIKQSYDRALRNIKKKRKGNVNSNNNYEDEKLKNILEHNLEQINYLNKKSDYLENKATDIKKHLKSNTDNNYEQEQYNNCNISKMGKLKFVTSSNGLKHSIENNVQGKINNNGFSIFYKNKKKMTYFWNIIELPIKLIGNVEQCFFFIYKNSNQIFCTDNKLKSASWVNSLTEASLCTNFGTKGILVNLKDMNDKLRKNKKIDKNVLTVNIKPEEKGARVFVNDKEQQIEDNGNVINLNKIKKQMEDEKKISKAGNVTVGKLPRGMDEMEEVNGEEAQKGKVEEGDVEKGDVEKGDVENDQLEEEDEVE